MHIFYFCIVQKYNPMHSLRASRVEHDIATIFNIEYFTFFSVSKLKLFRLLSTNKKKNQFDLHLRTLKVFKNLYETNL